MGTKLTDVSPETASLIYHRFAQLEVADFYASRVPAKYCIGGHVHDFATEDEAFEHAMGCTDGPDLVSVRKMIRGEWWDWSIDRQEWVRSCTVCNDTGRYDDGDRWVPCPCQG